MKKQKIDTSINNSEFIDTVRTSIDWGYAKIVTPCDYVLYYLKKLPALISYDCINIEFLDYLKSNFTLISSKKEYNSSNKIIFEGYVFVNGPVAINFLKESSGSGSNVINLAYPLDSKVDLSFIDKFIIKASNSNIGIFMRGTLSDLTVKKIKIKNYNIKDLDLYYGKGFTEIHNKIFKSISNNESGLYIFNGPPGTGKSSYIRHLASLIGDKTFIYVPEFMAKSLTNPELVELLLENKGSILVLEDAELFIKSRQDSDDNMVSTLLNLTDGLLSDILDTKIIVTYNTENVNVDKALLRKSRLKYKHEFNLLSVEDSQKLINSLKIKHKTDKKMSIAEIFKINDEYEGVEDKTVKKTSLGFV